MNLIQQKYQYKSFGLNISTDIYFPELYQTTFKGEGDVFIEAGDLGKIWEVNAVTDSHVFVEKNLVLFKIPDLAIFCVKDGNSIMYSSKAGADLEKIRLYLLGTCMGTLLLQKKRLCLHGSAIAIEGKAYAFVGESGAGKSTLATAFLMRGYQLISDDVIAINFDEQNNPLVMPSYPQQKLWEESLIEFGMDIRKYRSLFERETKFAVPVENSIQTPIPLAGVIELNRSENKFIKYENIKGLFKVATLFQHTYRCSFIKRLELTDWHFYETVKLINKIQMSRVNRPQNEFTAHELATVILKNI